MARPNPWRSQRLVYRAIEPEDEPFLVSMQEDAESWLNAVPFLATPRSTSQAKEARTEYFEKLCLLAVVICLPAPTSAQQMPKAPVDDKMNKPIPIGTVTLSSTELRRQQHRHSDMGIQLLRAYQGQGYGSEAIRWALRWGFRYGNLHRIELEAFEWNEGAYRLVGR